MIEKTKTKMKYQTTKIRDENIIKGKVQQKQVTTTLKWKKDAKRDENKKVS